MMRQDNLPLIAALLTRNFQQKTHGTGQDAAQLVGEFLSQFTHEELLELEYDWSLWARPDQLPPTDRDWEVWLLKGGRGSGKTRPGAEWILEKEREGYQRMAIVAETEDEGRHTLVEGESGLLACAPPYNRPEYQPENRRLIWPSGAQARLYSGDSPNQLRGPQHDAAWLDEVAKWRYPEETYANLEFGLRLGDNPQCVLTTTPRPLAFLRDLIKDPGCVTVTASTYANAANLPAKFIQRIEKRYGGTERGRQEIDGELLLDVRGALWTLSVIDKTRIRNSAKKPNCRRIVIGVDPQGKEAQRMGRQFESQGGETGIVVCGEGYDERGYVLDDLSDDYNPNQWAQTAVDAFHRHGADMIVAEKNNGGEMVRQTIHTIDPNIYVNPIWASDGKLIRAEPVSALYEQDRISHVGQFADLEDEMTLYTGKPGEPSPNRLDALVWAFTELFIQESRRYDYYDPARHENRRPTRYRGETDEQYEARCQAQL